MTTTFPKSPFDKTFDELGYARPAEDKPINPLKISIDTERTCWRGAVGRQRSGEGWAQMSALGEQSGPVVYATVYDADGPIERLVVVGSKWDAAVREKIRTFVAEFPGAEMHDCTTITAR